MLFALRIVLILKKMKIPGIKVPRHKPEKKEKIPLLRRCIMTSELEGKSSRSQKMGNLLALIFAFSHAEAKTNTQQSIKTSRVPHSGES